MTNLVFMDESYNADTRTFALTGTLIPLSQYDEIRHRYHQSTLDFRELGLWTINMEFMELHGSRMLHWWDNASDDQKLQMFERIVRIVEDFGLSLYRVTCPLGRLPTALRDQTNLLVFCWAGMMELLHPLYQSDFLIPVMDRADDAKSAAMSRIVTGIDRMRSIGMEGQFSLQNTANIIGEVFFSDSKHSFGIQIADVIGYLRHLSDQEKAGMAMSPFQADLLNISERVECFIFEAVFPEQIEELGGATLRESS